MKWNEIRNINMSVYFAMKDLNRLQYRHYEKQGWSVLSYSVFSMLHIQYLLWASIYNAPICPWMCHCVIVCVCLIFLASDWSEPWQRCTKFILYRLCTLVRALADQVYSHSQCAVHEYCILAWVSALQSSTQQQQ